MFKIAETLGGRTVAELGRSISWPEVVEWAAHFALTNEEMKRKPGEVTIDDGEGELIDPNHPDYAVMQVMRSWGAK